MASYHRSLLLATCGGLYGVVMSQSAAGTTEPCAVVSAAYVSQIAASPSASPTVAASVAHDCLLSVPLGQQQALDLIDSMEPYLEWQSDAAYKADPPADYFYPAYDMFATLQAIRDKVSSGSYAGEFEFQQELYVQVFGAAHDGHFVYYPDLLTIPFDWNRPLSLVSISPNQSCLPEIYVYEDVVNKTSIGDASVVRLINGVDAATYLQDRIYQGSWNQDADSAYNSMFWEISGRANGLGNGFFQGSGRIRYIYQGDTTNITFANGTEITLENYARIKQPLTGVTDGETMYDVFCNPNGFPSKTTNTTSTTSATMPGYPSPVLITNDSVVAGYYLDGEGYEDVAVIVLLAFENESPAEFQAVCSDFFAAAAAAGKTKLIVDFQSNTGGYILQGYDFFRQLFPQIVEDGFSRWKAGDSFLAISEIVSAAVAGLDPYTSDDDELIGYYESWFNYRYDLDIDGKHFQTFEDKFGPVVFQDTNYTEIMRWDLSDNLTTTNTTYGLGVAIPLSPGASPPFAAENIVMLYDGVCASTCTLASEMLRQAGVQSVALGGRPTAGPIQGVGGVKGAQVLDWSNVLDYNQWALARATANDTLTDAQAAALGRYTSLAVNRSSSAAVNARDQVLRPNVADGLPAQFVVEPTDCRLYWTLPMVSDVTAVWKAVADAAWNGAACAYGAISSSTTSTSTKREDPGAPPHHRVGTTVVPRDSVSQQQARSINMAKHMLKAIP